MQRINPCVYFLNVFIVTADWRSLITSSCCAVVFFPTQDLAPPTVCGSTSVDENELHSAFSLADFLLRKVWKETRLVFVCDLSV